MNKFHLHLLAACTAALALAHTGGWAATAGLTRAEVRQALQEARASNTMTPAGEIGDTAAVLAARESLYARQASAQKAQQMASASLALDALIAELQAEDDEDGAVTALVRGD